MRVLITLSVLALLALDWAALHDIVRGLEPSYSAEYTVLAASTLVYAALLARWFRQRRHA